MKLVNKNTWKNNQALKVSQVDNVNRAGYVPLDIQYESMRLAGIKLDAIRDAQYSYDLEAYLKSGMSIEKFAADSSLKSPYLDKVDLDDLYKSKLEKYSTFKSNEDRLQSLHKEYLKEVELKKIKDEAVNEYKRSLENKDQNV